MFFFSSNNKLLASWALRQWETS
ncbi:protein of unknown function [Paraburkholderia kururiensis]